MKSGPKPRYRDLPTSKVCTNCKASFQRKSYMGGRDWARAIFCGRLCAVKYRAIPMAERLANHSKRNPLSGCLEWTSYRDPKGYGRLIDTETGEVLAHRIAYIQTYGPIGDGLHILHHCDNESCIEPAHLYEGTNDDNMADRMARWQVRRMWGEQNPRAKLIEEQIVRIRTDPRSNAAIAREYGVSESVISSVKRRQTWRRVA